MIGHAIRAFLDRSGIPPCRIVAAVSGGADSTALLLALVELGDYEIVAAHVNHHLRGADSDADEAFVRELCERLKIEMHVEDGTLDEQIVRDRGIEAAAREVRYARLKEIREKAHAKFVATAHQKDDQAETVLMRLLTGSGIAGLRGIHPMREDGFIRPLLDVTRADVDAYLRERDVTPRVDRSNDDPRFLRNRVRGMIRELNATDNLAGVAEQVRAIWPLIERAMQHEADVETTDSETRLWLRGTLLQKHIRRLDPGARVSISKHLELLRGGGPLVLRKTEFEYELKPDAACAIAEAGVTMHVRRGEGEKQMIQLPPGADATFLVRNRRRGDRFQPLGLPHVKKLKDFLIDRKIAAGERDRLPLLVWNGEIVWIAGVAVSEKFKVTSPRAGDLYEVWIE